MRAFTYSSAATIDDVTRVLHEQSDGEVRLLAGGTDLLTLMKEDLVAPDRLIDIKRAAGLERGIRESSAGMTLGALTTLADVESNPSLRARYPALAEAATLAATPQLRHMATVGGNLLQRPRCWYFRNRRIDCWLKGGSDCPAHDGENQLHAILGGGPCYAAHPSDLATALVALDASVRLRRGNGERVLPVAEFFTLPTDDHRAETALERDELVLELQLPPPGPGRRSTYLKAMDRKVWAFALVGVAAALDFDGDRIAGARLVLGGVAPIPWRLSAAEQLLVGATPNPARLDQAIDAALVDACPLANNAYKLALARALLRRALAELVGQR